MPVDVSRYLGLFVSEATEHLEALGRDLVRLEREASAEVVDSLFRHAHSVKGMSLSMGFEPIAALAHRVEDLVDAVRSRPSVLDRALVDLLLAAGDRLQTQVKAAAQGTPPPADTALLIRLGDRLAKIRESEPPPAIEQAEDPSDAQQPELPPGAHGRPLVAVRFQVAPSCPAPGVRAFLVHHRLSELGRTFEVHPPLEELKAGRLPNGMVSLELELPASDPPRQLEDGEAEAIVQHALARVPDVAMLVVGPVRQGVPAAQAAPAAEAAPANGLVDLTPEVTKPVGYEPARMVRVRAELLDQFLETVGELLLATSRIREVSRTVPESVRPPLEEGVDRLHGLVKDLHDKVMTARMTPLAVIMDRLPRVARDVARRRDRDVELIISGAEIELDRGIVEELGDPLLHLLRNCIDHGIEAPEERERAGKQARGRVVVNVRRARDRVEVEIADDGRGMDPEKLKAAAQERGLLTPEAAERMSDREALLLCCMPGVSTARDVSDISGRGVGMDAVKRTVENVGGALEIHSEPGRGTRFMLRLPLTVAVVNLLLVEVGEEVFGLPIAKVLGAVEAGEGELWRRGEERVLPWGDGLVPVHALGELLRVPSRRHPGARPFVVMEADAGKVALGVDKLLGQEEAVLKALSRPLDLVAGLSGVTILGTGRPVFILDVPKLVAS